MERLEDIGFYTLSDARVASVGRSSPMWRGEIILLDRCNLKCPYCRGLRSDCLGDMPLSAAEEVIRIWCREGLQNIRFSGGEPTMYPGLRDLVRLAKELGAIHIAISTNGSADISVYRELIGDGVNDISISLDACCSAVGRKMCGIDGAWEKVVGNIRELSKLTYVTVGMVFTEENMQQSLDTIRLADSLGVSDIRVISAAQNNGPVASLNDLPTEILEKYPILRYRARNSKIDKSMRGLQSGDYHKCPLVLDDSAVAGKYHFPCIIYLREQGNPIGEIGPSMREDRINWFKDHDCSKDPICAKNCLDVCRDHKNKFAELRLRYSIPHLDSSLYDWLKWRSGSFAEMMGFPCRFEHITSDNGKKALREVAIGWCYAEELPCRPKPGQIAIMCFRKEDDHFWFHITKREFVEVFGSVDI